MLARSAEQPPRENKDGDARTNAAPAHAHMAGDSTVRSGWRGCGIVRMVRIGKVEKSTFEIYYIFEFPNANLDKNELV